MTQTFKRAVESPPPSQSLIMLIYGDPGSGKTFFAGTFGNDTLYINVGAGIATLYAPTFKEKHGEWNPFLFSPDPNAKESMAIQVRDAVDDALDNPDIKNIIIDDATTLQDIFMMQAVDYNLSTNKSKTKLNLREYRAVIPAVQDYGTQMAFIDSFMATYTEACRAMQKNFIVLAHAKREYGEQKGTTPAAVNSVSPAFIGKKNNIGGYFDFVWFTDVEGAAGQQRYTARTERNQLIEAKTRWGGIFPEKYKNPNYPEIANALETYLNTGKIISISK